MRTRNCPQCHGWGFCGHAGRCGFCGGKKKVSSEFIKWDTAWEKKWLKTKLKLEEQILEQVRCVMEAWEKKNPKPRKFPKK